MSRSTLMKVRRSELLEDTGASSQHQKGCWEEVRSSRDVAVFIVVVAVCFRQEPLPVGKNEVVNQVRADKTQGPLPHTNQPEMLGHVSQLVPQKAGLRQTNALTKAPDRQDKNYA